MRALCCPVFEDAWKFAFNFFLGKMSGDTDKAKISDNQDEDKKSGAGDGHTTEDESSQDSKGESLVVPKAHESPGNADVDQLNSNSQEKSPDSTKGDAKSTTANGKDDDAGGDDSKDEKDAKADDLKKEENGETHDDDDKEDVKENAKAAKKPAPKKKAKKEDTEEEDEDEEEEEEEEDDDEGEEDEKEEKKPKEKVKKPAKKAKDGDDDEEDEEDEEEGEEEEEEEEEAEAPKPKPKKEPTEPPVPLPAGKGIPLGHINNVEISLSRFKTQDQKLLHQYLYGQLCLDRNVKRNIKKFKGYEWSIGSSDYKAKLEETTKMEPKQLRTMCEMLDLDKKGSSSELATRLVGFLQQPMANSPHARGSVRPPPAAASATPGGRPRRSATVKVHNRGYSDEEYESDPETKVKGPKPVKDGSEDSDGSFNPSGSEEADSDFDPEAGEGASGATRKRKSGGRRRSSAKPSKRGRKSKGGKRAKPGKPTRGRKARSESEEESEKSESESENESASDAEESDEPKAKRGGKPAPAPVPKGRKGPVAKTNAKATPVKRKPPTPPAKKKAAAKPAPRAAKKGKKASSEEESGEGSDEEEGSGEEDEESDEPSDKKAKRPPTDDEIKKYVKQILEGANLEQITMKTVCKQVYNHYPDFDLAHKKDFIKATVKSLISS